MTYWWSILQSDSTTTFWPIQCKPEFAGHGVCTGKKRIKRDLSFKILPAKDNDKVFPKFYKNILLDQFWALFAQFRKNTISKKLHPATFEVLWFSNFMLIIYNPGHNILELFNILVQIRFTTSKRKLDI